MEKERKRKKKKWKSLILNFLMYGGWILVLGVILGIVILFSGSSK
jgi:hypothetical protein